MKSEDEQEGNRIAIVLGIIATYIALFSVKDALPFDISIVFNTSGQILLYLAGYLIMTAFCYRYDKTHMRPLIRGMDIFRRQYYDIGVMLLPFVLCSVVIWSLFDSALARTIGIIALPSIFIIQSYRGYRHKNTKQ